MAEQGIILDIDAKFLQNLKQADAALKASAKHAKNMTTAFTRMVNGSGGFAMQAQQLFSGLQKLGGMSKVDFSSGVVKMDANARTAADAVNLLVANISELKKEYSSLNAGSKNRGTHLRITSDADLENIAKLRSAISSINNTLNNKSRKKPLSLVDINNLTAQRDLYKRAIAELNSTDSRRTNRVVAEVNARIREAKREASAVRQAADTYYTSTPKRAINFASQAKDLDELRKAYKYLEQVRNRINPNTKTGQQQIQQLNEKMAKTKQRMREITSEFQQGEQRASQFGGILQNIFGLYSIKNFVNQLVRVRGEFEMQHRSLQVLLRNRDQADILWDRVVKLAVKSPFQVQELVTATKQLAAYRIETEKLYSTTKMLADISAGLGVEMNRLILAYGQVKAANFLRGTELRQFSEAGVNLLDELAARYSEIEQTSVTVAEVFERISKRQVSFEDVDAVLRDITSAGGAFYKMQEQQAETLKGNISNLKDEISLMFNDIGEENSGFLAWMVDVIRYMVKHWRELKAIMTSFFTAYTTYSIIAYASTTSFATALGVTNLSATKLSLGLGRLVTLLKALKTAIWTNPWVAAITAILSIGAGVVMGLSDKEKDVATENEKVAAAADKTTKALNEHLDAYVALSKELSALSEQDEAYEKILNARRTTLREITTLNKDYGAQLREAADDLEMIAEVTERIKQAQVVSSISNTNFVDLSKLDNYSSSLDELLTKSIRVKKFLKATSPEALLARATEDTRAGQNAQTFTRYYEEVFQKYLTDMYDNLEDTSLEGLVNLGKTTYDAWGELSVIRNENMGLLKNDTQLYGEIGQLMNEIDAEGDRLNELTKAYEDYFETRNNVDKIINQTITEVKASEMGAKLSDILALDEDEMDDSAKEFISAFITSVEGAIARQNVPEDIADEIRDKFAKAFLPNGDWLSLNELALTDWQVTYNEQLRLITDGITNTGLYAITNFQTTIEAQITALQDYLKDQEAIISGFAIAGQLVYTQEDYENALRNKEFGEYLLAVLGSAPKKKGSGKKDTTYTDAMKAIEDVHKSYRSLRETLSDTRSIEGAWEKYGDVMSKVLRKIGVDIDTFREKYDDLATETGFTEALKWLESVAKTEEDRLAIARMRGDYIMEAELDADKADFESAQREIEEMFSGYELSIELDKLHLPKDFAKDFFDVDIFSIEELRKRLLTMEPRFQGTDEIEKYQEYLDKLDEMEAKSQQERLKKYLEFSREAIGERAKIMLEGFYELQDIEKAFEPTTSLAMNRGIINEGTKLVLEASGKNMKDLLAMSDADLASNFGFSDETINKLREFNDELERQAQIAGEASKKKVSEKLNKMDWEAFRGSDTFQTLFNDLEGASEQALGALIKHLEMYKDQWSSLPLGQMKSMVKLLEQAKDAQAGLVGPMEGLRNARAKMEESGYSDRGTAEADLFSSEQRIVELDHELAVLAEVQRLKDEGYTDLEILDSLSFEDASIAMSQTKENAEKLKGEQEKISSSAKQYLDNLKKISKYYDEVRERASKVKQMTDKVFDGWDAVNELFEEGSMSQELAQLVSASANIGFEAFNSVQMFKEAKDAIAAGGTQAEIFGYQLNASLGIIGLIVSAIQIIAKVLKFAFEQHDKNLQKQIDAQVEKVDALKTAYEELERQIEKAYTAANLGRLTREAEENLHKQIDATEKMIALEEDKKKTDEEAIDGWKDDIADLRQDIEELHEETFSTLTDGILDDVLGATRGFVDAWHDAYEETGDGMIGLEETFTDMLRNMLRQQASMQLISPFIKKYEEWLKDYINPEGGDDMLTIDEAKMWAEKVRDTFPEVNELLENFFEGTQGLLEAGGELSDLEKGIQGMTEDQAEVLAAYWNSCRFMLSNIDMTLTRLASATLSSDTSSNPVLAELKTQTELLRSIDNMFDSVIATGNSNHSGAYLKVFMA